MYFSQRIRARLIVNKALNKCCINKYIKNSLTHTDIHKKGVLALQYTYKRKYITYCT